MESALGRKEQKNRHRKVTGDVEARICAIACSTPPEGASRLDHAGYRGGADTAGNC